MVAEVSHRKTVTKRHHGIFSTIDTDHDELVSLSEFSVFLLDGIEKTKAGVEKQIKNGDINIEASDEDDEDLTSNKKKSTEKYIAAKSWLDQYKLQFTVDSFDKHSTVRFNRNNLNGTSRLYIMYIFQSERPSV